MERFFDRVGMMGLTMCCSGLFALKFTFVVEGGQRAIIFHKFKGVQETVYGEGIHFRIPFIMEPKYYSIRSHARMITSTTGSGDL
jgi:regulator of protease activity HflC (stomatin/prohibitin superfamily)